MNGKKAFAMLTAAALVAVLAMAGCAASQNPSSSAPATSTASAPDVASSAAVENGMAGIAAIYSAPRSQIIEAEDGSEETADTFIYIFNDGTYRQYVDHGGQLELYSSGTCELSGELGAGGPANATFHVDKLHADNHELAQADLSYDVDLSGVEGLLLYPVGSNTDKRIVAAFMQVDKQRLVKLDGTETEVTTMWFYYDDGTFEQFAILEDSTSVLFSTGVYSFAEGSLTEKGSVMTLHRDQKYQDGKGLAPYDSTHDYTIGDLGFVRVYPYPDEEA